MQKFLSLLLTMALLTMSIVPALADESPIITVDEFKAAMNRLAKECLNWDMEWRSDGAFVYGNIISNPALIASSEYVSLVMVSVTLDDSADTESLTNLFLVACTLTAAAPAVRDGMPIDEATEMIWAELQAMIASGTTEAYGSLYGAASMLAMRENDEGNIDLTLLIVYTAPNAE